MTKIEVSISEKNIDFIKKNPYLIEELVSDYIEKTKDNKTKKILIENKIDKNLNLQLKTVLGI